MANEFAFLNMNFFTKASAYPGSIGTFRYRFQREGWLNEGRLQAWVYENISFELAKNVETETFDWTEEGVEALRRWMEQKLEERGSEPYRIPYPPKSSAEAEHS